MNLDYYDPKVPCFVRAVPSYDCYLFVYSDRNLTSNRKLSKQKFQKVSNTFCFAGLKNFLNNDTEYVANGTDIKNVKGIFISKFRANKLENNTRHKWNKRDEKALLATISYINEFTTCKLVTYNDKSYIYYEFFTNSYLKNLIILNFLRIFWHSNGLKRTSYYKELIQNKREKGEDSLKFLLRIYNKNLDWNNLGYQKIFNHSNISPCHRKISHKTLKRISRKEYTCLANLIGSKKAKSNYDLIPKIPK